MKHAPLSVTPRTDAAIADLHARHPDWSFEKTLRDLCYTLEIENGALLKRIATLPARPKGAGWKLAWGRWGQ